MAKGNKLRLVTGLAFNKLADLLVSPKTTLPALLISLGAPGWMVGWLVPIRESGALLPQAGIGIILRRYSARHHVWRLGMAVQITAVSTMVAAAMILSSATAGWVVLGALAALSLGRSACSLTFKDIEADIAPKGERGKLIGIASTASGVVTLLVAVPMVYFQDSLGDRAAIGLLALAALSFAITFLIILPVKTYVDIDGSDSESKKTRFWQFDSIVYRFVLVRGLFVHSALVAPYFMLESDYGAQKLLPLYLAAQAAATMLSSFFWGTVSDKSARLTLQIAGVLAIIACAGLLIMDAKSLWVSGVLFFILSVAHAGVRTGRKTYSLDVKSGQDRTELVAFSNTAIGLILLGFGALYAVLEPMLSFSVVYLMAAFLALGIALSFLLPKEKSDNE